MKVKDQVKLFKNIIENEYRHIRRTEVEDIEDNSMEYCLNTEKKAKIMEKLQGELSAEIFAIIIELEEINTEISCIEQRHYFKEGVKAGLDNLSFLDEYDSMMLL